MERQRSANDSTQQARLITNRKKKDVESREVCGIGSEMNKCNAGALNINYSVTWHNYLD